MVILVPDEGRFEAIEKSLTPERLGEALGALSETYIALSMPRWAFDSPSISLADMLEEMGMTDAFAPGQADFSGMDGTRDLYISKVFHQAFVSVNEAGTEAAAATAVVVNRLSGPREFTIDRPFIYLIRDIETDTVLFLGRVTDPS
jgi:serpin B